MIQFFGRVAWHVVCCGGCSPFSRQESKTNIENNRWRKDKAVRNVAFDVYSEFTVLPASATSELGPCCLFGPLAFSWFHEIPRRVLKRLLVVLAFLENKWGGVDISHRQNLILGPVVAHPMLPTRHVHLQWIFCPCERQPHQIRVLGVSFGPLAFWWFHEIPWRVLKNGVGWASPTGRI